MQKPRMIRLGYPQLSPMGLLALAICLFSNVKALPSSDFHHNVTIKRIAFGSCHKNKLALVADLNEDSGGATQTIWSAMQSADQPEAWLWTGDAVYTSRNRSATNWADKYGPASVSVLQEQFHQLATNRSIGYADFAAQIPHGVHGTWDDHDMGGNDMGRNMPDLHERKVMFWDFLGLSPPPGRQGMYHSVSWEERSNESVQAIFLDSRWFRDDHCIPSVANRLPLGSGWACLTRWLTAGLRLDVLIPFLMGDRDHKSTFCKTNPSVLGETQWQWLEDQLKSSSASVVLLISSIQVLTTNPTVESWGQFPSEQQRLVNLIQSHQQRTQSRVLLLSGDAHYSEFLNGGNPDWQLQEVTSSGMTHYCSQPKIYGFACRPLLEYFSRHRRAVTMHDQPLSPAAYYIGKNYGLLTFDWERRLVIVKIKTSRGKPTQLSWSLSMDVQPLDNSESVWHQLPHTFDGHLIPVLIAVVVSLGFITIKSRKQKV